MQESMVIPWVNTNCEICEEKTDFQLQFAVDVSVNESLSVEARAYWFCTECYEQEIACETDISWSN